MPKRAYPYTPKEKLKLKKLPKEGEELTLRLRVLRVNQKSGEVTFVVPGHPANVTAETEIGDE